ncbi:MAG: C39 family peptidase, partial [Oscillospiraceae bacterium]|nr:C39 family peptidase [Oscillospiraceae bacterium]
GMGYGIFSPGLVKTAQNTLDAYKIAKTAVNISGCSEQELFDYARQYPVIVWCTMNLQPVDWGKYYWHLLPNGKIYQYPGNEHCCVLVDYTDTTVKLYDPINGIVDYDKTLFLQRWNELGPYKDQTRQAVIIK